MERNSKRTTVTSALPYANGPVYIGHLAGVYVPADIYVRYLRLKKEDVLLSEVRTNTEYPSRFVQRKEGVTPQDVVDRYHYLIKKSFEEFGVSFDVYSRTTSKTHHQLASISLRHYTTKESLSKNFRTILRRRSEKRSLPTAISPESAPLPFGRRLWRPMRNAEPPCRPPT